MSCDDVRDRIDRYIEHRLPAAERDAVAAHLETCAECRTLADDARALAPLVARLPERIEPARDLWPGIRGRVARRPGADGMRRARPWLAAAAALVLVAGSSLTTWLIVRTQRPVAAAAAAALEFPAEARYLREVAALSDALDAQRGQLAPATVATLERNLAIIDRAIAESRAALAADPANGDLQELLRASYEQKVALLEQATRLPERS